MVFGLVLVFGLILLMNHYMGQVEKSPPQEVTEISMTREIKQEPKKEIKKVEQKKQVSRPQAPAPFKGLDMALSGIDLGLLGLDDGQGKEIDDGLLGKTGNAIMTADLVDVPPKPITRGSFKYPPAAKKNGIKGYVLLSVLVETDGSENQVRLLFLMRRHYKVFAHGISNLLNTRATPSKSGPSKRFVLICLKTAFA